MLLLQAATCLSISLALVVGIGGVLMRGGLTEVGIVHRSAAGTWEREGGIDGWNRGSSFLLFYFF